MYASVSAGRESPSSRDACSAVWRSSTAGAISFYHRVIASLRDRWVVLCKSRPQRSLSIDECIKPTKVAFGQILGSEPLAGCSDQLTDFIKSGEQLLFVLET